MSKHLFSYFLLACLPLLLGTMAYAESKANGKVLLRVTADIHGSAHKVYPVEQGEKHEVKDEFTSRLTATVEYRIDEVIKEDNRHEILLEGVSHTNQINVNGAGQSIWIAQAPSGLQEKWDWTYSVKPTCNGDGNATAEKIPLLIGLPRTIRLQPPYELPVSIGHVPVNCVVASGPSKNLVDMVWNGSKAVPKYEEGEKREEDTAAVAAVKAIPWEALNKKMVSRFNPDKDGNFSISGSASESYEGEDLLLGKLAASVTVHYSVQSGDIKEKENEMVIAPKDAGQYDKWIPSPAGEEKTYGPAMPLTITAKIRKKGGHDQGEAPQGRIDFWLRNVSRHHGKCSNYPKDGAEKDDLRFAADQPDVVVDPADPKHAYTTGRVSEATVVVEATDTGGYGTLQAVSDELGLIAKYESTGAQSISIPRDDNDNHVADQWEKDKGIFGDNKPATWDEDDIPADQRRNGDGYTLYEEYRGFMTKSGFVRTSPKEKDLFVYDPDGLVKQYYEPYNPAKLNLHYIDPTMMKFNGSAKDPENRWVNCNSSHDTWYARQYALYVVRWTTMSDGAMIAGEGSGLDTVMALQDQINGTNTAAGLDSFTQPLKNFYMVKISPSSEEKAVRGIKDPNVRQAVFNADFTSTVIHEIGHAIGIRHHHSGAPGADPDTPADQRPTDEQGGVFDCSIRYRTPAEYQHPEMIKPQTRYCGKNETWKKTTIKKDAGGNKTATTETVAGDNCFGQIDVKSDP